MSEFKTLPSAPALRVPATRRISLPVSQRLSTITEGAQAPDPGRWSRLSILRASTSSAGTNRTPPPPYEWAPPASAVRSEDAAYASEEEKLARLRRTWSGATGKRGGWGRLVLLVIAIVAILGLAIGLGVGLTIGRKQSKGNGNTTGSNSTNTTPQDSSMPLQQFPLGQFSFSTTLRTQQTNCTTNPATWRCYPYTVFDPSNPSTLATSQSTFDWIIQNSSAIYANDTTPSTPLSGVPANLTISSTANPFALTFAAQELTYAADSNATSPRLTFTFSLPKIVVPTAALTSNNAATQCYFNSTILSGTIYLDAQPDSSANTTGDGSYQSWPYADEITQSSPGGEGTPECYEVVDGNLGERVSEGFEDAGDGAECRCEYRNFG
jgi:hypothetical protein